MNTLSRTLTGGLMVSLGIFLLGLSLVLGILYPLIYAIPILIIGIFVLFNKKEDEIEQIRKNKTKKKK
jgi:hypothetical protein